MLMKGDKPSRPSNPGEEMSDGWWDLVQKCWNAMPHSRPDSEQLIRAIRTMLPSVLTAGL